MNVALYLDSIAASNNDCVFSKQLFRNSTMLTAAVSTTIQGNTPVQAFAGSMGNIPDTTLAAGDRLNLKLTWAASTGCGGTRVHFGGTTYRSSLSVSADRIAPPNPPTGLSATTLADGTTQLSWSPPAYGNPISFYRIYRDGTDYTKRLDLTGSATDTTFVDPQGSTHTYYVTAVSDKLAESTMTGPVTK